MSIKKRSCDRCSHYQPRTEFTGTCWRDGSVRDSKENCWWFVARLKDLFDFAEHRRLLKKEQKEKAPGNS